MPRLFAGGGACFGSLLLRLNGSLRTSICTHWRIIAHVRNGCRLDLGNALRLKHFAQFVDFRLRFLTQFISRIYLDTDFVLGKSLVEPL